jgi:hypothetical protein
MLWQRFTERARRAVFFSQEEAGRLKENSVSPEHLLLGLLRVDDSSVVRILDRIGVSPERVRSELERQVPTGDGRTDGDKSFTPRAIRVIDLAYDEARQLNNDYIGTEHLLLGLIRESDSLAGRVLPMLGVDLERTRAEVRQLQEKKQPEDTAPTDDAPSEATIDAGVLATLEARDAGTIWGATSVEAYLEWLKVWIAQDTVGYREMVASEAVLAFPSGTEVKVLWSAGARTRCVRVRGGAHDTRRIWVQESDLRYLRDDDTPFPPD